MKNIQMDLSRQNVRYAVKIGGGIVKTCLRELLSGYAQKTVFVITNTTIVDLYPDFVREWLPDHVEVRTLSLPDGEEKKNLAQVSVIYDFLIEHKANRKSVIIALGGGVVGDIAGFAASTFMRGVACVQVPTTLLSQVDSGIGGKTGINHGSGKNLIGTFKQPLQTIIDVDFLGTLPEREFIAGYAELVKHGFIRDAYLFQILRQKKIDTIKNDRELLIEAVFRSCEVKARVVEADEHESNQRAILNFGHTLGHFLEAYTGYQRLLHGEAVIIGMDFAAWWSFRHEYLEESEYQTIHDHLKGLGVSFPLPRRIEADFRSLIEYDKKYDDSGFRFVGLTAIGQARVFEGITTTALWEAVDRYIRENRLLQYID
jgi:3-dehydroquinate synthase